MNGPQDLGGAGGLRAGDAGAGRAGVPRRLGAAGAGAEARDGRDGRTGRSTRSATRARACRRRTTTPRATTRSGSRRWSGCWCATASSPRRSSPPAARWRRHRARRGCCAAAEVAGDHRARHALRPRPGRARAGLRARRPRCGRVVMHPRGHTRLPRYARGKARADRGGAGLPRLPRQQRPRAGRGAAVALHRGLRRHASSGGATAIRTAAVSIDAWESYLEPA